MNRREFFTLPFLALKQAPSNSDLEQMIRNFSEVSYVRDAALLELIQQLCEVPEAERLILGYFGTMYTEKSK